MPNGRSNRPGDMNIGEIDEMIDDGIFGGALSASLAKAKRIEAADRNEPPRPMPQLDRSDFINQMKLSREEFDAQLITKRGHVWQTMIGNELTFSTSPLSQLSRICIEDMSFPKRHEGHFLLCRIVTPATRTVYVDIGIEDPNGWLGMISLHNFPGVYMTRGKELDTIFPLHTIIAIREPRARKESPTATGNQPFIEVDSPSDLIFLDSKHPTVADIVWSSGTRSASSTQLSPTKWKEIGNDHFKHKEFFAAAVAYTYALRQDSSFTAVRLNRCLAHLRLSNFGASVHDAKVALATEGINKADRIKALARAAQAHYGSESYEDAIQLYEEWLTLEPGVKDAVNGIKSCNFRIRERDNGEYNWKQLLLDCEMPGARPDVAEYIGPVKAIPMESGEGFKVVATRDAKAGELLVVSKAFACAFPEESLPGRRVFTIDFLTNRGGKENQYSIFQQMVTKIAGNYPRSLQVLGLPAGPNFPRTEAETIPYRLDDDENLIGDPLNFSKNIDTARIEAITSFSSFEFPHASKIVSFVSPLSQLIDNSIALHIFPSFFRHSCIPNARWMPFGHIMIIRAVHDIAEGEEVTISYCGWRVPFMDRKKPILRYFSDCKCRLCLGDEAAGDKFHEVHQRIYEKLDEPGDIPLSVSKEYAKEVDAIWPESYPGFRPLAFHVHRPMASESEKSAMLATNAISRNRMYREGIKHEIISIEALGAVVIDKELKDPPESEQHIRLPVSLSHIPYNSRSASLGCLMISGGLVKLEAPWRAEMWLRSALYYEDKTYGGGLPLFRTRYARILNVLEKSCKHLMDKIEKSS